MTRKKPKRRNVGLRLRMPPTLHARLADSAHNNANSLNREICQRLAQSYLVADIGDAIAQRVAERCRLYEATIEQRALDRYHEREANGGVWPQHDDEHQPSDGTKDAG